MPDYSACRNSECLYRMDCARYRMLVNNSCQSYASFTVVDNVCSGWWVVEDAPWNCYSVVELEIYEANIKDLKRINKQQDTVTLYIWADGSWVEKDKILDLDLYLDTVGASDDFETKVFTREEFEINFLGSKLE